MPHYVLDAVVLVLQLENRNVRSGGILRVASGDVRIGIRDSDSKKTQVSAGFIFFFNFIIIILC